MINCFQVELVRHNSVSERSEELVLDTHRAVAVEVVTEGSRAAGPARIPAASVSWGLPTEHALGFLSALVLFLLLLAFALLYSSRLRSQHHLAEKLLPPEEHNFYRGKHCPLALILLVVSILIEKSFTFKSRSSRQLLQNI
jgi:hypothetical protein